MDNASVNLAPTHKVGLTLANPVMPAAGCFGFDGEYAPLVAMEFLGAVVVGPFTAGPRRGATPPRLLPLPNGALLHTGLANPGLSAVLRRYARLWTRLPAPVIVHVAGTSPNEVTSCCRRLTDVESVVGIELGLPDLAAPEEVVALVQAARESAIQPLIVRLPLASAPLLCRTAAEAGADALTVAAPPRGAAWHGKSARLVSGRLYGPRVLPLALYALSRVSERTSVPLIGCGGIHSTEDAQTFLRAGAKAIQVDSLLWHDPTRLIHIAHSLDPSPKPC